MRPVSRFFLCLFLGTGISFSAQTGTTLVDSIKEAGVYRGYRLYVPASYTSAKKIPLVINIHGLASNALQQQLYGNFMAVADTAYFLVLHPEGTESGSGQYWNPGLLPVPNDVQFVSHLIDSISGLYNVDADRIYSCGLSNGGILSYYLACNLPNRITAIASVAGTMFRSWFNVCKPSKAVPVLEIHGTEDGTVPYEGNSSAGVNGLYMPVDTIVEKWRSHNQCQLAPLIKQLPDKDLTDFSNVTHMTWSLGADKSSVELFKVNGGSHSWPGATVSFFHQNMDFNASIEIWRFFSQYKMSQFTTNVGIAETKINDQTSLSFFPNPVAHTLHIVNDAADRFCVFSIEGKKLIETSSPEIAVDHLSSGLYILEAWNGKTCSRTKFVRQ